MTDTHIRPALTETEKLPKYKILTPKTASNLKPFLASAIEKRKHLTLNLKPEMASENQAKAAVKIGHQATCWHLLHHYTNIIPDQIPPCQRCFSSSEVLSIILHFNIFRYTHQKMAGHMILTTKSYQLQGGTGRGLRLVCKITLRPWIQNLDQT